MYFKMKGTGKRMNVRRNNEWIKRTIEIKAKETATVKKNNAEEIETWIGGIQE